MGYLTGVVCFFIAFCLLSRSYRCTAAFDTAVVNIGWLVVTLYAANLITKVVLSLLPKTLVSPENKAVLITGCDSGFGHSLAKRLCKFGFTVFAGCLDQNSEGAEELKKISPNLHVVPLDVTKHDEVQAAVKDIESRLGDQDLWALVNNAGVTIFSELEWCSMSIIEHMFKVNVLGAMRVTKAFLPLLRKSKGRIVVVASVVGHVTYPGFLTYCMTKHALVSFADGLRREMRKWGVAVSTIEPSLYRTRLAMGDFLTYALDNSWEKTPEPIKEAYGFPYYEDFKHRMLKMAMKARPYVEEVVDSMERAIVEESPSITYRCSGPLDKVRLWLMSLLPVPMLDLMICHVIQPNRRQLSGYGAPPRTPDAKIK